jgi:N-acetylmuramoyl-L-alanine amidase
MFATRRWGFKWLFVSVRDWERKGASHLELRDYEILDIWAAIRVLDDVASKDPRFLGELADAASRSGFGGRAISRGFIATSSDKARMIAALRDALGTRTSEHGKPPRFARLYICQRKPTPRLPVEVLDPWREVREAIFAAERAPRGFVTMEVFSEDERPLSNCRLEVLLSDGEFRSVYTNLEGRAHLENIPQGQCHIRVPEKDGGAWHPAAGASSARVDQGRHRQHVVQQGDHIGSIAHQYGVSDAPRIWHAPENKQIRTQRTNPNVLMPGDQITVPGIAVHEIVRPTDTTHRLVVKEPATALLRLRLIDEKREPIADGPYEVRENGRTVTTGVLSSGNLECRIPASAKEVTLVFQADGVQIEQLVRVGALDPVGELSGIQARLANLGWYSGQIDGKHSDALASAANAFRGHAGLAKGGDLDEAFQKALAREHGV